MIDGKNFILTIYPAINNQNDVEVYKTLYHPDALWCPPYFEDKRGVEQIGFAFGFKNLEIKIRIIEVESFDSQDCSYVTGLVDVCKDYGDQSFEDKIILRGSWLVVEFESQLVIRYQVWNEKKA